MDHVTIKLTLPQVEYVQAMLGRCPIAEAVGVWSAIGKQQADQIAAYQAVINAKLKPADAPPVAPGEVVPIKPPKPNASA